MPGGFQVGPFQILPAFQQGGGGGGGGIQVFILTGVSKAHMHGVSNDEILLTSDGAGGYFMVIDGHVSENNEGDVSYTGYEYL